jgi:hypothetical protein
MTTVVVDQGDIEKILKEAEVGIVPDVPDPRSQNLTKKPEVKTEAVTQEKPPEKDAPKADGEDPDDIEGDDGLTPRQKREYTAAMLKSLAKKHAKQKSAEEFATDQYNTRRLAEERAQQLQAEVERLQKAQIRVEPVKEVKAPVRSDFESDEKFAEAVIDYRVDQKLKAQQAEEQKRLESEQRAKVLETARSRIATALELVPDFKQVTESADFEVPSYIANYMQESELFAEIGYHLAKHPEELQKLQKMRPDRALVEIGKIESKLTPFVKSDKTETKVESGNGTEKPKSSNGDKPSTEAQASDTGKSPSKPRAAVIKPLTTGSANQVEKPHSEMNAQEALEAWQAKRGVNLTRRQRH